MQDPQRPPHATLQPDWLMHACSYLSSFALLGIIAASALAIASSLSSMTLSPLIVALLLGAAVKNSVGVPSFTATGIKAATRRALRAGVVVLGLQLSLGQIMSMGAVGTLIVVVTLIATFIVTVWLGDRLGVDRRLTQLIAAGTSICGASAIVATNTVTHGTDEDVAYAVAAVSIFGSMAVLLYPVAGHLLQLTADGYGLWAGASIHEIGQVAAAADVWESSSEAAMIAKLCRVLLLAPTVLLLAVLARSPVTRDSPRIDPPWFLAGFILMMLIGSTGYVSHEYKQWGARAAALLLTLALAGLGLELDVRRLRSRGWRPLLLGALSTVFIGASSLAAILLWSE